MGPPGVGKNELVYKLAQDLGLPLYVMLGHEEFTPEDLSLVLVPGDRQLEFRLQGSALAAAVRFGGLCFFDEINRVPPRALSPLASILDIRQTLESAMAGMTIERREDAQMAFRSCCAMNPEGDSATSSLPGYVDERTLPVIRVSYPSASELFEIVQSRVAPPEPIWESFKKWYSEQKRQEISIRQAISLVSYAMSVASVGNDEDQAIEIAAAGVFRDKSSRAVAP
jgi:MoxR-like ATPase